MNVDARQSTYHTINYSDNVNPLLNVPITLNAKFSDNETLYIEHFNCGKI